MECEAVVAPDSWDGKTTNVMDVDDDHDESASECSSSSQSTPLLRHSSLAELSNIATASSPLIDSAKLDLEENATNSSLALDNRISNLTLAGFDLQFNKPSLHENMGRSSHSRNPVTPPKERNSEDPLTPTANLKMLVSAASPAIRDREIKKRELFARPDGDFCLPYMDVKPTFNEKIPDKTTVSRKDKSLGLLCQRFLSNYPETPPVGEHIEIGLDDVAKSLNVERRRIYDIVNVLESVEVISRYAKNRYVWHGKTRLPDTLARLKASAVAQGFTGKRSVTDKENPELKGQTRKVNTGGQLPWLLPKNANVLSVSKSYKPINPGQVGNVEEDSSKKYRDEYCRKDKSLGVLSQKFLMMFLVSETKQVTLEDAANVLIDDAEEGQAKFKTKVRRLYDIANILSSLQLIEKVHIHSLQSGRKPGFRWIGVDLDKLEDMSEQNSDSSNLSQKKSTSEQAVLSEANWIKQEPVSAVGRFISRRPSQQHLRQANKMDANVKCKMPRSRSDKTLMYKKKNHINSNEDDGYSVQELGDICDSTFGSPTEVKFRSELKKLQEQYPDRMSQLLFACNHGLPNGAEGKKSRRTLFFSPMPENDSSIHTGPKAKRLKGSPEEEKEFKSFVHSSTSAFRPVSNGANDKRVNELSENLENFSEAQKTENDVSAKEERLENEIGNGFSPKQKIYLERQKQKELLQEQSSFNLQDERWKRIERELEKAFSNCHPNRNISKKFSDFVNQSSSPIPRTQLIEQSSVGIQASLIDTVSPLKPLSYNHKKCKSPEEMPAQPLEVTHRASTMQTELIPFQQSTIHNAPNAQLTHPMTTPANKSSPSKPPADNIVLASSAPFIVPVPSRGPAVVWNSSLSQSTESPQAVIFSAPSYNLSSNNQTPQLPTSTQPTIQSAVRKPSAINLSMPNNTHCSMSAFQPKSITVITQLTPTVKPSAINPVTVSAETPSSVGLLLSGLPRRLSLPIHGQAHQYKS